MLKTFFARHATLRSLCLCFAGVLLGVVPGLLILQIALAGPQATVSIAGFSFQPQSVTIRAGETITWTNQDSAPHTVTANDGTFDSGNLSQNVAYSHTFTQTGVFSYFCGIHPSMIGAVNVVTGTQVFVPIVSKAGATR